MKDKITRLLKSANRPGIQNLIDYMEEAEFFTAPCSGGHHLAKEGGLAEHSVNVCDMMLALWVDNHSLNAEKYGIMQESIIISALLHDLGKASYRLKPNYVPNILASGKQSTAKPYETNKDRLYIPHEVASIVMASQFIELTDEEEFAIMYHNGKYVPSGRDLDGKERPLQQLLHFCDMWCSRFVEKGAAE